jgi:hypothetical protein
MAKLHDFTPLTPASERITHYGCSAIQIRLSENLTGLSNPSIKARQISCQANYKKIYSEQAIVLKSFSDFQRNPLLLIDRYILHWITSLHSMNNGNRQHLVFPIK